MAQRQHPASPAPGQRPARRRVNRAAWRCPSPCIRQVAAPSWPMAGR